jgi:L-lactate dehydrogenase complex protein LldE
MPIQLFVTCLIDTFFPETGEAVVQVLGQAGLDVAFPSDQTCCGQPAFNAGLWDQAGEMAAHTIEVFERTQGPIVIPSGSCAAMIRHGYRELFAEKPEWLARAQALAERTYELSEFLVEEVGVVKLGAEAGGRFAYHPSCHLLRGLGLETPPIRLLKSVPGAEVQALEPECCGFGGAFAVEHSRVSEQILARKLRAIEATGAEFVTSCDVSCLMHMEGGLRKAGSSVRALHLAQVLAGGGRGLR